MSLIFKGIRAGQHFGEGPPRLPALKTVLKLIFFALGELVARGSNVMRGYWNDPQDTALAFRDGMFRTGDIGYQDSDGYFYILDRLKDMIVTGGENVYSGEVEAFIYKHPAVRDVAVFGIPVGELVMACVVLKPGMALSANDLTSHCRQFRRCAQRLQCAGIERGTDCQSG